MDTVELLFNIWRNHKGKIIGVIIGLIFAIFVTSFGFFEALFICFCIGAGFFIGKKIDAKVNIRQSMDDIFRN